MLLTREALRLRELQASRLEATATQARLDALAARLEPHFLFNALQSVSAPIDSDPARARTMLAQIGDLLRDALAAPESGEVSGARGASVPGATSRSRRRALPIGCMWSGRSRPTPRR
ncbi:MAG: histidine kinase [Gemmatimonadetes bacterium]|nr:histidine kinase [Gemmatimonadota bacterium]